MAKLPPIKKLVKEDFAQYPWAEKLLWPLNRFMEAVYSALDKHLTPNQNMIAQTLEIQFIENNITYPIPFAWDGAGVAPTDLIVTRVVSLDNTNPSAAVTAYWNYDGTTINVYKIFGLDGTKEYKIRMLAFNNG